MSDSFIDRVDSNVQFQKDETHEDAIYSIGLKKTCYAISSINDEVNGSSKFSSEPCIKESQEMVYTIRAGTMDRLVDSFVREHSNSIDCPYLNVFLHTYRTFTDPITLLKTIELRFNAVQSSGTLGESYKLTYANAMKTFLSLWLETHYLDDFNSPPNYDALTIMLTMVVSWRDRALKDDLVESLDALKQKIVDILGRFHTEHTVNNKLYRERSIDVGSYKSLDIQFPMEESSDDASTRLIDFEQLEVGSIAQQLTLIDKELFIAVVPHQCLLRVRGSPAPSVDATIRYFNQVVSVVMTTILRPECAKHSHRAELIGRWIDVAAELRALKNFSSLKAVICGLESHDIFRLKHSWKHVEKYCPKSWQVFQELSKIVSAENNQEWGRKILQQEGTAKYSEEKKRRTLKPSSSFLSRLSGKKKGERRAVIFGTIPYMGTFLTDLTMIHTKLPDMVEGNLINFEKRRQEFTALASISVYQSSAKNYTIERDPTFHTWFHQLDLMDAEESKARSLEIEPQTNGGLKRDDSSCSASSVRLSKYTPLSQTVDISNSSGLDESVSLSSSHSSNQDPAIVRNLSQASLGCTNSSTIVKMRLNTSGGTDTAGVNYKCIRLNNTEKVHTVIKNSLEKFNISDAESDQYCLLQILPDREIQIPEKSNVYYALTLSAGAEIICEIRSKEAAQNHEEAKGKNKKNKKKKKEMPKKLTSSL